MTEEPGESEEGKALPVLTSNDINQMKFVEFRSDLQAIGMTKNGLKAVLVSRLEEAIEKNMSLMQNLVLEVIEHYAGGDISADA